MTDYQISSIQEAWRAALLVSAMSAVYWFKAKNPSQMERLAVSAHGIYFAGIFFVAVMLGHIDPALRDIAMWVIIGLEATGLALVVLSLWRFQGPKLVHLLVLPLLAASLWLYLIAVMTVTHDWM